MQFLIRSLLFLCLVPLYALNAAGPSLVGSWEAMPDKSTDIDLYGSLAVRISMTSSHVTLVRQFGTARRFVDSLVLPLSGKTVDVTVTDRVFPTNVFMGLSMVTGSVRTVRATKAESGLQMDESYTVRGSQGEVKATATHNFACSPDGEVLTYTLQRSTRPSEPPVRFLLKRSGWKQAYVIALEDNWEVQGKLYVNAFLISLQGIANKSGPLVYVLYPENWPFTYVRSVFGFYRDKKNFSFKELRTAEEALTTLKSHVKGYVVWDKKRPVHRSSLRSLWPGSNAQLL